MVISGWLSLSAQSRIAVLNFHCGDLQLSFGEYLVGPASGTTAICRGLQNNLMSAITADPRVRLVTHSEQAAVAAERDLQRDEDFLEGYVVDQWAAQGVEYFLIGHVSEVQQRMSFSFVRALDQKTIITEELTFTEEIWSNATQRKTLALTGLERMLTKLFPAEVPLVKVLKGSKAKARTVLIAGGTNRNFRRHQELAVKTMVVEDFGDGTVGSRAATIAHVVVAEVENKNFSRCVVMFGGQEIMEALNNGQEVFIEAL